VQLQLDAHANLIRMNSSRLSRVETRLDLTAARLCEDQDEQANRSSENKIVVHGLPRLSGSNHTELRSAAHKQLTDCFAKLFPNFAGKYTIISASYFDSDHPVYEATLSSVSESADLRRSFGKRSFASRKASGLKVLNSVTPGTRVRLSILRSICTAYKKANPAGSANLLGYLPRPVVKYRPGPGPFKTSGFVDTVTTLTPSSLGLQDSDFFHAYRAAGRRFPGKLQSTFLVLSDSSPQAGPVGTSETRKRHNDGTPVGASASRRQNLEAEVADLEVFFIYKRLIFPTFPTRLRGI